MAENVIEIPDDYEDISFLNELDAVEAQAISLSAAKRRRTTTTNSPSSAAERCEGAYTAALKGSRSVTWQNQSTAAAGTVKAEFVQRGGSGGGSGACYKCGMEGHWARDCNGSSSGTVGTGNEVLKECACGLGSCLVLTANTERNRGRKFYRCPVRQENGGCGFFEWCDETSGDHASLQERARKSGRHQDVYQQPSNRGTAGFTRSWDDYNEGTNTTPKSGYGAVPKFETTDNKSYGVRAGSACFKCGEEGHWARDCPTTTSTNATTDVRDKSTADGCYKCGQSGHWAKDCSQSQTGKVRYH